MTTLLAAPETPPVASQLPAHLLAPTSRYVEAGLRGAANTVKAYAGDWQCFSRWCQLHHLVALPATVDTLAGFLAELAGADSPTADKND